MNARQQHAIDELLAFHRDVQVNLRQHYLALVEAGWSVEEAWIWVQITEERIALYVVDPDALDP